MSSFASKVKKWYEAGYWTRQMVENAYDKGRLTAEETSWILGD